MTAGAPFAIDRTLAAMASYFDYAEACKKGTSEHFEPMPAALDAGPAVRSAVDVVAFYLPQFHRLEINDRAWGRGFTEWTNVTRALPMFRGHRQPHLPIDLGFYDLANPDVLRRQIALARHAGLKAFCFHTYWFGGTFVMDAPLRSLLSLAPEGFGFMLCWANETWSRLWDGGNKETIIAQHHEPRTDRRFIHDILPYLSHPRYHRAGDRLPLVVYAPALITRDLHETLCYWRDVVRSAGLGELLLLCTAKHNQAFSARLAAEGRQTPFDGMVQFPPIGSPVRPIRVPDGQSFTPRFHGQVLDYRQTLDALLRQVEAVPSLVPTVIPSWDNTARKASEALIFVNSDPPAYEAWLTQALRLMAEREHRLVFVNAWNEWAEGAHLEPCSWYGHAYLAATRRAVIAAG